MRKRILALLVGLLVATPVFGNSDLITASFTTATTGASVITCASTNYLKIISVEVVVSGGGTAIGYIHKEGTRSTTNTLMRFALPSNLPLVKYFADVLTAKDEGIEIDLSSIGGSTTAVVTIEYREF